MEFQKRLQLERWWNRRKINQIAARHLKAVGVAPIEGLGVNVYQLAVWWSEGPGRETLPARILGLNSETCQLSEMGMWAPKNQMKLLTEIEQVSLEELENATPEEAGSLLMWSMFNALAAGPMPWLLDALREA